MTAKIKSPRHAVKVEFTLEVEQDQLEVRGNAMASGDDAADRECEDAIIARLDSGDMWAWAWVRVTARVEIAGKVFEGSDSVGGCSYANEAEFKHDACYQNMRDAALADLKNELRAAAQRGFVASRALRNLVVEEG